MNKKFIATIIGSIGLIGNASAGQLLGWELDLTSLAASPYNTSASAKTTGINNLAFGGESYITNTFSGPIGIGSAFTFTDTGVFNIGQYNGGINLKLGLGELTAVFNSTGSGNLGGSITFNAGGILALYYQDHTSSDYGSTASNNYGAGNGTKIAEFEQLAGGGGGVNPNGTPTSNGQLTLNYKSTFFAPNVWKDTLSNDLPTFFTLGFVTSNASQDNGANSNPGSIDPNLVTALGGALPNAAPISFFVANGGQFKLETQTVPEPTTLALLGMGLLGASFRKRKQS